MGQLTNPKDVEIPEQKKGLKYDGKKFILSAFLIISLFRALTEPDFQRYNTKGA